MHNAAAADLNLDLAYVPLPVEPRNLKAAIHGLSALGFLGVNVTVPHKQAVIPLLDEVDAAAGAIGAVNTIVISQRDLASRKQAAHGSLPQAPDPWLRGHNTDWSGFMADLETIGWEVAGKECIILGAGGAARAVAFALATSGGRVRIFARRVHQAKQLVEAISLGLGGNHLSYHPWDKLAEEIDRRVSADRSCLIVNATPIGMLPSKKASPWPSTLRFPESSLVYDLVYNPAETEFMRQARAAGCLAANGLGMLIHQGAQAFQLWTGLVPNLKVMRAALPAGPTSRKGTSSPG